MFEDTTSSNREYWQVKAGAIRKKVPEDTEGAKIRSYQIGDMKGTVCEIVHAKITGRLTDAYFSHYEISDGRKIDNFNIVINDQVVLSMKDDSQYTKSIIEKLLNVDLNKDITVAPYDFETKEGRKLTGVSLVQDNVKIGSSFFEYNADKKTYKSLVKGFDRPKNIKWEDYKTDNAKKIAIEEFKHEMMKLYLRINDYVMEEFEKRKEAMGLIEKAEPIVDDSSVDVSDLDIPF